MTDRDIPTHPGLTGGPVYLDYNATTPIDPRVTEAMLPYLGELFGNPSSGHSYAEQPRRALAEAREQVAALIGARPEEIVFTASGSEADVLALHGVVRGAERGRAHVITQATEHPAIVETCRALHRLHDTRVTVLPVEPDGRVTPDVLAAALARRDSSAVTLVSIMAANNETGARQPVPELAALAHEHGALVHCDAAQAVGKVPVDVAAWGVDLLTVVGHKMYAPKGAAALYVRDGVSLEPLVYGGGQERGLRAGTENTAFAVALGVASDLAAADLAHGGPLRQARLRDALHEHLREALPDRVHLNGPTTQRLPNTLNVSIDGIRGHDLLAATPGVAASTGSACHSGVHTPSPVLTAMGVDADRALAAVRLSLGRWTTDVDVDVAAADLITAVAAVTPPSETARCGGERPI